jgi:PAS domain S-box-containing protein
MSVSIPARLASDREERSLFSEVASDIAFALFSLEREEERKRAEDEVRRLNKDLERLVAERTAELEDMYAFSNAVLNSSPVGIITYRSDGTCVSANESAGPLIGATRQQVLGQNFRTIQSWRESGLLACAERCLETGEPQRLVISITTTFGKEVSLETRLARFMAREEPHLLLTFNDVTDRARAARDLRQYAAQLEAANEELEAFAYSVSHDLRAPLRGMDGFSQALLEDYGEKLDATGKDYARRVRAASQRMGRLIDDILQLSRVTRRELEQERVELSGLVRATAEDLQKREPERRVTFAIEDGVVAEGDAHLLSLALENLLGNAWKFTQGEPEARIEFGMVRNAACEAPNEELEDDANVCFVRDNGAGFEMAYAGKLFQPFQRLHSAAEFSGTGIGLATVQRIVRRHGGRAWAKGAMGEGAVLYFTLGA